MDVRLKMPQSKSLYQQIQHHVLPSFKTIWLMTMHDIVDNATLLYRHNITFTIFKGFLTLARYLIPQKQVHFIPNFFKFRDGHKGYILFHLFLSSFVLQHL